MPATVVIELKNSPKVQFLIRDADNLLTTRGFRIFSQNPRIYYNNDQVNSTSLDSVVKMIKQSEFYNQTVKTLLYTAQFKK